MDGQNWGRLKCIVFKQIWKRRLDSDSSPVVFKARAANLWWEHPFLSHSRAARVMKTTGDESGLDFLWSLSQFYESVIFSGQKSWLLIVRCEALILPFKGRCFVKN